MKLLVTGGLGFIEDVELVWPDNFAKNDNPFSCDGFADLDNDGIPDPTTSGAGFPVLNINRELGEFQQQFTKSDKQDCLAMLLLTHMVKQAKEDNKKQSNISETAPILDRLEAKLSEF